MKYFLILIGVAIFCQIEAQRSNTVICQANGDGDPSSLFAIFDNNIENNAIITRTSAPYSRPFSKNGTLILSINSVLQSLEQCFGIPAERFVVSSVVYKDAIRVVQVSLEQKIGDWRVFGGYLSLLFGYNEEILQYHGSPMRPLSHTVQTRDSLVGYDAVVRSIQEHVAILLNGAAGEFDLSEWLIEILWFRPDILEYGEGQELLAYSVLGSFKHFGPFECYGTHELYYL